MALKIVWNNTALENISEAIEWISKDSIQQAENVEKAIIDKIEELVANPNKYPLDKFKKITQATTEPLRSTATEFLIESLTLRSEY